MGVRRCRFPALVLAVLLPLLPLPLAAVGPLTTPSSVIDFYQYSVNHGRCAQASKMFGPTSARVVRASTRGCLETEHLAVAVRDPGYRIKRINASYTCLGVHLTAQMRNGTTRTTGGWYLMEKTPYYFWHILLTHSHIVSNAAAQAPLRPVCAAAIPSYAQPSSSQLIIGSDFLSSTTGWIAASRSGAYVSNGGCMHGIGANCNSARTAIYRTDDGGRHWRKQLALTTSPGPPVWIKFFSPRVGLAAATLRWTNTQEGSVAHAVLLVTTDGGKTWARRSLPAGYSADLPSTSFPEPQHGWIFLGAPAAGSMGVSIYATASGGQRWKRIACTAVPGNSGFCQNNSGIPFAGDKEFLTFATVRLGWLTVVSNTGTPSMLRTTDGGRTWSDVHVGLPPGVQPPSPAREIFPMGTLDPPSLFGPVGILPEVVGFYHPKPRASWSRLYLFRSSDGGRSWHFLERTPINGPSLAQFETGQATLSSVIDDRDWFFVAGRTLWYTADAGTRWFHAPMRIPSNLHLVSLTFTDLSHGWALALPPGQNGGMLGGPALLRTDDRGKHWKHVQTP
jgi:photosystem II stability/assembly factor-like uncharacterized protein